MTFPPANFDPSIDPTTDQVRELRDAGPDGPVVMLNLLKFREQANYPAGSPHAPCSGAEAYRRYQTAFVETVGDVSRAEVVWEGQVDRTFIGDATAPLQLADAGQRPRGMLYVSRPVRSRTPAARPPRLRRASASRTG